MARELNAKTQYKNAIRKRNAKTHCNDSFKVHLHCGENCSKLMGFKKQNKIFCFLNSAQLRAIFAMV